MSRLSSVRSFGLMWAALWVSSANALAQQPPVLGLRVFGDVDFKGPSAAFVRDVPDLAVIGLGRTMSSLQVADGEVWELCTEPRFAGRCRTVSNDISDLRRGGWNDAILSARRVRGGATRGFGPAAGRNSVSGIHLFGDINFRGRSASLTMNVPDLEEQGMSRVASSIRVDPDEAWQVCTEANYRGRCVVVSEDQSDLRRGDWNDVIVSARRMRGPSAGFTGGRLSAGLEAFADINFRGRSSSFAANTPNVASRGMGGTISSLRVAPGEIWEVCTEPNFAGRCEVVAGEAPDLRRGEWNDVIASVRRVR